MQLVLTQYFNGGRHLLLGTDNRFWHYDVRLWRPVPDQWVSGKVLVLLRHEFLRRDGFAIAELQHGHRGRVLTSAPINRRRMVAIEFGM